jgi:hypothetical protein
MSPQVYKLSVSIHSTVLTRQDRASYQTSSPQTGVAGERLVGRGPAKLLHGDADQGADEGADGGDKLRGHGGALGEARLDEQGKVADLVGDLVEEDGDGGGGADGGGGVEAGRHGEAVGDVVGKVGDEVEVAAQLDAGVDFLLVDRDDGLGVLAALVLLARLGVAVGRVDAGGLGGGGDLVRVVVGVPVGVVVAGAASRNAEALVHGDKGHEADEDGEAKDEVAVGLDEDEAGGVGLVLAEEDLGQQVEEGVAQQAADGKGNHDGQRRGVNVGRAQGEQEVGGARDVERGEQGVDGGRAGEQRGEELRGGGLGGGGVVGVLGGGEVLDDGTGLQRLVELLEAELVDGGRGGDVLRGGGDAGGQQQQRQGGGGGEPRSGVEGHCCRGV